MNEITQALENLKIALQQGEDAEIQPEDIRTIVAAYEATALENLKAADILGRSMKIGGVAGLLQLSEWAADRIGPRDPASTEHSIKYPQYQKLVVLPMLESVEIGGKPFAVTILDTYDVNRAFEVNNPAQAHAVKKILRAGNDHNSYEIDMRETKDAIDRAVLTNGLSRIATEFKEKPLATLIQQAAVEAGGTV